jgi:hypothetical protein
MKKTVLIAVGIVTLVALGMAGYAYAQAQVPPRQIAPGYGYGHGPEMMGWTEEGEPPMHDYVFSALAEGLGLTPEELEARHEAGERLWDIAQDQGLTAEELRDLMLEAREGALEQAVSDGVLTQEQADWMLDHMGPRFAEGYGPGSGHCDGSGPHGPGFRGSRGGRFSQP